MTSKPASRRIDSIDLLRGLVIVLMGLDHVRDYFSPYPFQPENLDQASAALFLTRWVTHFCAPVFLLLAGVGAWLWQAKGRSRQELARFLVTRGLWLILLEVTVINLGWLHFIYGGYIFIQVIWAIGCSMIFLAALLWLPRWAIAATGLVMVAGHNLFDGVSASQIGGPGGLLWAILHQQYWQPLSEGFGLVVVYPLVPWLGVMALGYALGPVFQLDAADRRRTLTRLGLGAVAAFVLLRLVNVYGDPNPWQANARGTLYTALDFLNTTKYPASLLFLLMTLGPAIWLPPRLEGLGDRLSRALVTFGRVPLFFYLIHVPVIHVVAALWWKARFGVVGAWAQGARAWPEGYEPDIRLAWVVWVLVTIALYPVCRWFAGVKRRRRSAFLSYL